jgi:hypothetical protein
MSAQLERYLCTILLLYSYSGHISLIYSKSSAGGEPLDHALIDTALFKSLACDVARLVFLNEFNQAVPVR